jgi:putative spermidine/putrescine transport system permease protein
MKISKWARALFIVFYVSYAVFLYGPMFSVFILSFQGVKGGMIFPLQNFGDLYWWKAMLSNEALHEAFLRSFSIALMVMVLTVILSLCAAMCLRGGSRFSSLVYYCALLSLLSPGIVIGLGINVFWKGALGLPIRWYITGVAGQLSWTLPFGVLVMIAVFNRFDPRLEEAAKDLGASKWTTFREILLPNIFPGLLGAGLFGFTLAYDELSRTMFLTHKQTLPMRIYGMRMLELNPDLYALGTATTIFSFVIIATFLIIGLRLAKSRYSR